MEIIPLIIQLVCGAGAALLIAKIFPKVDENIWIKLGVGAFGGLVVGQLSGTVAGWFTTGSDAEIATMATAVIGGMIGGGGLLFGFGSFGKEPLGRR